MYILFLHNIIMSSIRALTLPIPQAHFIWYCAWLSIPSAIYAYSHPRRRIRNIPPLLERPDPRFMASQTRYHRRIRWSHPSHVLRAIPSDSTHPDLSRAYRCIYDVIHDFTVLLRPSTVLARNIHARNDPPRRQYCELGTVLWH